MSNKPTRSEVRTALLRAFNEPMVARVLEELFEAGVEFAPEPTPEPEDRLRCLADDADGNTWMPEPDTGRWTRIYDGVGWPWVDIPQPVTLYRRVEPEPEKYGDITTDCKLPESGPLADWEKDVLRKAEPEPEYGDIRGRDQMSKCVSVKGEPRDHTPNDEFVCTRCLDVDLDAVHREFARLNAMRHRVWRIAWDEDSGGAEHPTKAGALMAIDLIPDFRKQPNVRIETRLVTDWERDD